MTNPTERPNIVYIDCHDLGDWLGCYGRKHVPSPNIDRLAREGALFSNQFAASPICMPSRAALYTGRYPHAVGCYGQEPYDEDQVCMGKLFHQDGYKTMVAGWQICNPWQWAGYEHALPYEPASERTPEVFREHSARDKQPFFAHFSFNLVHRPFRDTFSQFVARSVEVPPCLPDTDTVRQDLACLCYLVASLDGHVGRILDAIRENGLEENTIVVFAADHGPSIARAKHTLYDTGIRTALIIRYPRLIHAGRRHDALLGNVDLLPTLLELAGLPVPDNVDGRSFLALLTGAAYTPRTEVYSEQSWGHWGGGNYYQPSRCLRTGRYKFIRNYTSTPFFVDPGWLGRFGPHREMVEERFGAASPQCELYDIQADPWELSNLAADPHYCELRAELAERLSSHLRTTGDAILSGSIPYKAGLTQAPLWEQQEDGSYRLRPYRHGEYGDVPFGEAILSHTPPEWPR